MPEHELTDEDGFWKIILKKRYEKIPAPHRNLEKLTHNFYVKHSDIVDRHFNSEDKFLEELQSKDLNEGKTLLTTLWAEKKWESKSTGDELEVDGGLEELLSTLQSEEVLYQELDYGFTLVWPSTSRARTLKQDGGVEGAIQEEAHPIILKKDEDDEKVEMRGGKQRISRFTSNVTNDNTVTKVEPELSEESIIENLEVLLEQNLGSLRLIEVKFRKTYLPNNSSLEIRNDKGILEDLNAREIRGNLIDRQNLADLDHLKFLYLKTDNKPKVNIKRTDEGFKFSLNDSNLNEEDKKVVRRALENHLEIEFNKVYSYNAQHAEEEIVNKILAGKETTYDRYYEDLRDEAQDFIDRFIDVSTKTIYKCYACGEEHDSEFPKCQGCNQEGLHELIVREFDLDKDAIIQAILDTLEDMDANSLEGESKSIRRPQFKMTELGTKDAIHSVFSLEDADTDGNISSYRYEFFLQPLGRGTTSRKVNKYLLNTVLFVYGDLYGASKDFGTISLYEFLNSDTPGKLFLNAVVESNKLLKDRIFDRYRGAYERLVELNEIVEGPGLDSEKGEELKESYDYKKFERDIFYLFKFMFNHTERWGREGKTETDGCIIAADENEEYKVFSYDPKLTYDPKGYDINKSEKDKAAFYLLSEAKNNRINRMLSDGEGINGHIFVSDQFREGQFSHIAERVHDWFELVEDGDEVQAPVIFLSLNQLLTLFEMYDEHYDRIKEHPRLNNVFKEALFNALQKDDEDYVHVNEGVVEDIRSTFIEEKKQVRRNRTIQDHQES